ncbi:MFS transporter [Rhizobacter sp. Root1221]|nr:MFS transporter [Rhizobacter sp. Root1221]
MTGVRLAAPLQALHDGRSAWSVGVLMALFALAPVVLAIPGGRLADRLGYHRPLRLAVALSVSGAALAVAGGHYLALCLAATLCGAGANLGLIAIQRSAGRTTSDPTERLQVFSWLGLAPAMSNLVGPVMAGTLIDLAGFRVAFAALAVLPLLALAFARAVPEEPVRAASPASGPAPARRVWDLLGEAPVRRLLFLNWLLSASWDVHNFVVPILGHERGLDATAIGLVLGAFAVAVAGVRLLIPVLAHRLTERQVLVGATLATGFILAVYPFVSSAWAMAVCAALLGLPLGSVQPMIMSLLHEVTPHDRHGEAIALRSMSLNLSSSVMPLCFGVLGAALGAGVLFWLMGAVVAAGSLQARRVPARSVRT